ncbi:lipase 3-like isoform X2 [Maniola jurtina]|uniref:lipase 3-like isoform X1 n=1 Tax=Maniola jurtina TaxID=191418 RepID=UPI001E68AC26|nr:lipase 3-like isoform X1 [Maniola jurtina]XP_045778233.1 lipase 3-like isoform X2 [Maniola jurtina]
MGFLLMRLFLILCLGLVTCERTRVLKKEAYATVPELIATAGYPIEKHRVTTEDGYIIQMHRIPAGRRIARKAGFSAKGKKAVLIVHGLLGSSGDFVIMGPERSLAYLLADEGYDVWLGNLRGNIYTSHVNYTKRNPKFWNFSFHEHGKYDVPAMVDKILNVTSVPKVMYVGYSMGTTSFFVMMSERPEYNDKIISFVALAPAVYLSNIKPLAVTALKTLELPERMRAQGMLSVSLSRDILDLLIGSMCFRGKPEDDICMRIVYMIVGEDNEQYDKDITAVLLARAQPASWRHLEHFGKIAISGVFTSWEDGLWGRVKPYNITNVKVPVTLLYGGNDQLTEKNQIMRLADELSATGMLEGVRPACEWPKFNHLDFAFARDVGTLLNRPLVVYINTLFNKYGPK